MKKDKKYVIWSSMEDYYREEFEEWCERNGRDMQDDDFYERCGEEKCFRREDEKNNLDKECGQLIAIADLGFWDGRVSGYRLLGNSIASIFDVGRSNDYYDEEYYCKDGDCRADLYHHDNTHHILFREIRPGKDISRLCEMLYNGEEVDTKTLNRYTRSIGSDIAKIYGWS